MTIYVDPAMWPYKKVKCCHMATDARDIEELHLMAERIGLKRRWFQKHDRVDHYDLFPTKRLLALKFGAVEVPAIELVSKCRNIDRRWCWGWKMDKHESQKLYTVRLVDRTEYMLCENCVCAAWLSVGADNIQYIFDPRDRYITARDWEVEYVGTWPDV